MAFVLTVSFTHYASFLADPDETNRLLVDCRCAHCGVRGQAPRATSARVQRKLATVSGFTVLSVGLARCPSCKRRERILPCDALPGKVSGADLVFDAVARVQGGEPPAEVAKKLGVCELTVRLWVKGVSNRARDLFTFTRHRAIVVASPADRRAHLCRFSAYSMEAQQRLAASLEQPTVGALLEFIRRLGGTLNAAMLGAAWFRQAVLLFRTVPIDTSIFESKSPPSGVPPAIRAGDHSLDDPSPSPSPKPKSNGCKSLSDCPS